MRNSERMGGQITYSEIQAIFLAFIQNALSNRPLPDLSFPKQLTPSFNVLKLNDITTRE